MKPVKKQILDQLKKERNGLLEQVPDNKRDHIIENLQEPLEEQVGQLKEAIKATTEGFDE